MANYNTIETENAIDTALTEAWKTERLGKFTSSSIDKLMIKSKTPGEFFGDGAISYIYKKAGEILTQEANEIGGRAIEWGNEYEGEAVETFARMHNKEVDYFGKQNPVFIPYLDGLHAGGSPDGEVKSERAVIETKCPYESMYHAEVFHLIKMGKFDLRKYDKTYYGQLQFNIELTGAEFGYFISYDPRCVDRRFCLAVARVEKDQKYIDDLKPRIAEAVKVKTQYLTDMGYFD